MVTVLKVGNLKYKVNQKDHNPPHVHVEGGGASVRISLLDFSVMDDETDFSQAMVNRIVEYVQQNKQVLIEKWVEYHGEAED